MINVNTERGEFGFGGNLTEIAAETLSIIQCIYNSIKENDERAAKAYKYLIETGFSGVFLSSDELDKMRDKKRKEAEEGVKKLQELLDKLKALEGEKEEPSPEDEGFKEWLRARDD